MSIEVKHEEEKHRFLVTTTKGESELTYVRTANTIDFTHTFVHPGDRGSPVGHSLVKAGVDWAEAQQADIVASCWYVEKYLQRQKSASTT